MLSPEVRDIVVVTITLARTASEEESLLRSLAKLFAPGLRLVVADGGSSRRFTRELLNLGTVSYLVTSQEKGLVAQVKAGLVTALRQFPEAKTILYTEPDKYPFFEGRWKEFIGARRRRKGSGVLVAARDSSSLRTFPRGQQETEGFMNEAFSWIVGRKGDYCYGPLLLSRRAAEIALEAPNDFGWGWRFWTMQQTKAKGLSVHPIELNVPCPREQRAEDSFNDRMYRLKQLKQNIQAVVAAAESARRVGDAVRVSTAPARTKKPRTPLRGARRKRSR